MLARSLGGALASSSRRWRSSLLAKPAAATGVTVEAPLVSCSGLRGTGRLGEAQRLDGQLAVGLAELKSGIHPNDDAAFRFSRACPRGAPRMG